MSGDGSQAENRVRKWAGAGGPNEKYRDAFVLYDGDNKDNFTYKLPIADVIDSELTTAVPRARHVRGRCSGRCAWRVDVPDDEMGRIKTTWQVLQKMGEHTTPGRDDWAIGSSLLG